MFDYVGDPLQGAMSPLNGNQSWLSGLLGSPLGQSSLLGIGGSLLGGLGSLIGGPSQSQKRSRDVFGLAKSQYGKQFFDPNAIFGNLQQGLAPQFNLDALNVSKRLGLSSGVAQGELAERRQSTLANLFGQIQMQSLAQQSARDLQLLQLMLGSAQSS